MSYMNYLDEIWDEALEKTPCRCGIDDQWEQEINGSIFCNRCSSSVVTKR
ncbi:hypothetical protein [Brevibacillus brevis]|nr:hypothetical protein [Brevibacillus brevis]